MSISGDKLAYCTPKSYVEPQDEEICVIRSAKKSFLTKEQKAVLGQALIIMGTLTMLTATGLSIGDGDTFNIRTDMIGLSGLASLLMGTYIVKSNAPKENAIDYDVPYQYLNKTLSR